MAPLGFWDTLLSLVSTLLSWWAIVMNYASLRLASLLFEIVCTSMRSRALRRLPPFVCKLLAPVPLSLPPCLQFLAHPQTFVAPNEGCTRPICLADYCLLAPSKIKPKADNKKIQSWYLPKFLKLVSTLKPSKRNLHRTTWRRQAGFSW